MNELTEDRAEYLLQSPIVHHEEGPNIEIYADNINEALTTVRNRKPSSPEGTTIKLIKFRPRKLIEIIESMIQQLANGDPMPESQKLGWITPEVLKKLKENTTLSKLNNNQASEQEKHVWTIYLL